MSSPYAQPEPSPDGTAAPLAQPDSTPAEPQPDAPNSDAALTTQPPAVAPAPAWPTTPDPAQAQYATGAQPAPGGMAYPAPAYPPPTGPAQAQYPMGAQPAPGGTAYPAPAYPPATGPAPEVGYPPYQPAPGYGQPGYPGVQPPYGASFVPQGPLPPQPAKSRLPLIIVAAVVALALIVFAVFWFGLRKPSTGGGGGGSAAPTSATQTNPATSSKTNPATSSKTSTGAVQGFLEALAAGDSAAALAFIATPPMDTTFLTDAVLAKSNALGAISNIEVAENTTYTYRNQVDATYQIGTQRVTGSFETQKYGNGYLLTSGTYKMDLSYRYQAGVGMALNGVSLDNRTLSSIALFPGMYEVTVSNPFLTLTENTFAVSDIAGYSYVKFYPQIDLAPDAAPKLSAAAKTSLDSCMQEKALKTSCGFGFDGLQNGATADTNSLAWSFYTNSSDDFSTTTWRAAYDSPTQATASLNIILVLNGKDTAGHSYRDRVYLIKATADFSNPDAITVSFR